MTQWYERFGFALNALGDAFGAALNIVTSPFDDDDDSYGDLIDRFGRIVVGAGATIGETVSGVLGGLEALAENVVAEPASALVTTASLLDSPTWQRRVGAAGSFGALSSLGDAWDVAREMANERSFGQAVWAMFSTEDIIAEEQKIEQQKDSILFNAVTGTLDAALGLKYDPTILVSKTGGAIYNVRKGINVGHRSDDSLFEKAVARIPGIGRGVETPDELADSQAVTDFIRWAQGKSGREIANHPAVARSAYPSVLAGLLQEADEDTARLIIAVAYGSDSAYAKLAQRRDDLAMRLARADNALNTALEWELVRSGEYKTYLPKPAPPDKRPKPPEPEQIPLFDIGQFPIGKPGKQQPVKGSEAKLGEPQKNLPRRFYFGYQPGKQFEYPNITGNIPESVPGEYFIAPKFSGEKPYRVPGPINPEAARELMPYLRGDAKKRKFWEQLAIPGLPPEQQFREASSWAMHDETLAGLSMEFGESSSARIKPFGLEWQRWWLQLNEEIKRKGEAELDLLNAAIGRGGDDPGRGVWASMQDYAIRSSRDLKKADRALAYDWESKSVADEQIIYPKTFGSPIRVIKDFRASVVRGFTEKRPPRYIDPNRGDSHSAFAAFLNSIRAFSPRQKSEYLRRYMAAFTPEAKRVVIEEVEKTAIKQSGEYWGLSEEAAEAVAEKALVERNALIARLRQKKQGDVYGVRLLDGEAVPVETILFESQVVNSMPLLDIEKYWRAFRANQGLLKAADEIKTSKLDFIDRAYDVFNQLWSFNVLMRFGYTVRTLTDDMLRLMASFGAMSIMAGINAGFQAAFTKSGVYRPGIAGWLKHAKEGDITLTKGGAAQRVEWLRKKVAMNAQKTAARLTSKAWGNRDVTALKEVLQEITDKWGRDIGSVRRQDELGFEHDGWTFEAALTGRGSPYARIVGGSYEAIARTEKELVEVLRKDWAGWEVKRPQDPGHLEAWAYAAVNQLGKSAIARQFLDGKTADEVERWLRRTPQGRAAHKAVGQHHDPEDLAGQAQAVVDYYLPVLRGHDDPFILRRMAKEGTLTAKILEEYFPNVLDRPSVHGPTIDFNLYQGGIRQWLDNMVAAGFKWISQIPSDRLVRHPTFNTLYRRNVRLAYDNLKLQRGGREEITADDLRAIEHMAREKSLREMNGLLYNLAEKSNIAHLARFFTGFFSAWEDSIRKWAGLAISKPHLLYLGHRIWEAPNGMNLGSTEDELGNRVERVQVVDEQGRQVKRINGRNMVRNVDGTWAPFESHLNDKTRIRVVGRFPEWLRHIFPGLDAVGSFDVPKSSLNLILQGDPWWLPGAGPLMQVAVSEIERRNPAASFDAVYEWAIPFGRTGLDDLDSVMLPPWLKQAIKGAVGIEDNAYAVEWLRIAQTEEMRIRLGLRERPKTTADFAREIDRRANAMFNLRSFVRFFLPFSADFNSPYQFFIDQYRQLREVYGDEADERFYERYGEDLFLFTTALSKNNIGVTATRAAFKAVEEYKDLIMENPEYGALIVGPDALRGEFDPRVYTAQFEQTLGSGSSLTVRERRTPIEALKENRARLGWVKYRQWMSILTTIQHERGLDESIVAEVRGVLSQMLAEQNPDWGKDYYETDLLKIPHRIDFFKALVKNEKLLNNPLRTDLRVLNEYLKERDRYVAMLMALKDAGRPYTLDAEANKPIADAWEQYKLRLAQSDTRFEDLYNRFLVNDRLQFVDKRRLNG